MSKSVQKLYAVLATDAGKKSTMQQEVVRTSQRIDQLAADKREANETIDELKLFLGVFLQKR